MLRLQTNGSVFRAMESWHLGGRVFLRWTALLGLLLAVGYATGFDPGYPRGAVLTWAVGTPVLLLGTGLLLNRLMRRAVASPGNVRSAVITGFNPPGKALAERLAAHPELCLRVEGFFDDRAGTRLGPMEKFALLGRLAETADYVRGAKWTSSS